MAVYMAPRRNNAGIDEVICGGRENVPLFVGTSLKKISPWCGLKFHAKE